MKRFIFSLFSIFLFASLIGQNRDNIKMAPLELKRIDAIKLNIESILEQHTYLEKLDRNDVMNNTEWIKLYNMGLEIDPYKEINPGLTILRELQLKHTHDPVLISVHKTVKLQSQEPLMILLRQINEGRISADEAARELMSIETISKEIYGVGVHLPARKYGESIRIKILDEYQFIPRKTKIYADNMDKNTIVFRNTNGDHTIDIHIANRNGSKTIKTQIMSKEDADKYLISYKSGGGGGETLPCGDIINQSHSTFLTTGLPCTGGCPPNQPTIITGETLTIPGNDGIIDRVVIITDGIDFTGAQTVQSILSELGGISTFQAWLNQGIDVMIVDWPSPMGFIENNSQYFRSIIEDLNASPDFVAIEAIVGISMGGIISRHTLIEMEEDGVPHNVKTWVSGDSPQEGSNVSVGVQSFARESAIISVDPAVMFMNNILDSPAARQLLLHSISLDDYSNLTIHFFCWNFLFTSGCRFWLGDGSVTAAPDPLHTQLWNWFNGRYPSDTQINATIADGGTTPLGAVGATILNYTTSNANILTKASNGLGSSNIIIDKNYNSFLIQDRETVLLNDINDIDVAPGSTFNVGSFNQPPELIFQNSWSFATSTSAVGIPGNPQNTDLSSSPFDAIYMTPTNDAHSLVAPAKIAWLQSQMDPTLFDPCAAEYCEELFEIHECRFGRSVDRLVTIKNGSIHNTLILGNHTPDPDNFTTSLGLPLTNISINTNSLPDFVNSVSYTTFNGNINLTVDLDQNYIEDYFESYPLPPYPFYCTDFDFNLELTGMVEFEGCNGDILGESITIEIVYTYTFCTEVIDLDGPVFRNENISTKSIGTDEGVIQTKEISISPNPAQDFFVIEQNNLSDQSVLTLYHANGVVALRQNVTPQNRTVNTSGFTPGLYFLEIVDKKSKWRKTTKVVIN